MFAQGLRFSCQAGASLLNCRIKWELCKRRRQGRGCGDEICGHCCRAGTKRDDPTDITSTCGHQFLVGGDG